MGGDTLNKGLNVLSLFDGLSGGRIALDRLGVIVDNYYASEIDENAIKIAMHNYPEIKQVGDVTKLDGTTLPKIDLLLAGSPCQGFSRAGKGLALEDERSKLFFEFVRLLKETKPKYFLLENVLMKDIDKQTITDILGVYPIEIDSGLVSGQRRKRLYWTNIPNVTLPEDRGIIFKDILDNNEWRNIPKFAYGNFGDKKRISRMNHVSNIKANTLTTNNSHTFQYLLNEDKNMCRLMTSREWERLQTLPEGYTDCVSKTKACHAIGNGWTIDVIVHILKGVKL